MRINVIDSRTNSPLFDYKSPVVPRIDESIVHNDETGYDLVVDDVVHVTSPSGEPYVNLFCTPQ